MSSSSTIPSIGTNRKESSRVSLPYLPDELLSNCLARASRLYHPTLSLVSKRFRSLLISKELYENRKLLCCTESCLYVCLSFPPELNPSWYSLCRRPTRNPNGNPKTRNPKGNPKFMLVSVPTQGYFPTHGWDVTAVNSNIYMMGGSNYNDDLPSSKVSIMDCQSHTWCEAPSMQVAKKYPYASVLDGKIYVSRGDKESYYIFSNGMECFNPKTQKWEDIQRPNVKKKSMGCVYKTLAIEGKLYLLGENESVRVYKANENRWGGVGREMNMVRWKMEGPPDSFCVIDNVFYGYGEREIQWYDFNKGFWRVLKGLSKRNILPKDHCHVRLVDYGGKLAVLWEEEHVNIGYEIWCAKISIERRNKDEIFGKVAWCEVVLRVPKECYIDKCVVVTV